MTSYIHDVSAHIQPLLMAEFQTTAELDNHISHVAEILKHAAARFFPKVGQKKSKQRWPTSLTMQIKTPCLD